LISNKKEENISIFNKIPNSKKLAIPFSDVKPIPMILKETRERWERLLFWVRPA
jgi:hypothetical protein